MQRTNDENLVQQAVFCYADRRISSDLCATISFSSADRIQLSKSAYIQQQ
jgi:hypothetical protein